MEIKIELQPISTPNYVLAKMPPGKREDGFKEGLKYRLPELPVDVLSGLCDEFRVEVFKKAGKEDPRN